MEFPAIGRVDQRAIFNEPAQFAQRQLTMAGFLLHSALEILSLKQALDMQKLDSMFGSRRTLFAAAFGIALAISAWAMPVAPAQAGANIYDAQVLKHLKLANGQRSKARRIVRKSDSNMMKVFRKYKINPRAKPDFDKLVAASSALQTIERTERNEMKKILNAVQLKHYDQLIDITRIRVRKAAN
jgi:hypothetical protein